MTTFLFAIGLIGLFFVLMSVRMLFLKNGNFRGTCASQSPWLKKEGTNCNYCGKPVDGEECGKDAVDKQLSEGKTPASGA